MVFGPDPAASQLVSVVTVIEGVVLMASVRVEKFIVALGFFFFFVWINRAVVFLVVRTLWFSQSITHV